LIPRLFVFKADWCDCFTGVDVLPVLARFHAAVEQAWLQVLGAIALAPDAWVMACFLPVAAQVH